MMVGSKVRHPMEGGRGWRRQGWTLVMLLGLALLLLRVRGMSLWIDEDFTARHAGQTTVAAVVAAVEATMFHCWFALFPGLEWTWR